MFGNCGCEAPSKGRYLPDCHRPPLADQLYLAKRKLCLTTCYGFGHLAGRCHWHHASIVPYKLQHYAKHSLMPTLSSHGHACLHLQEYEFKMSLFRTRALATMVHFLIKFMHQPRLHGT